MAQSKTEWWLNNTGHTAQCSPEYSVISKAMKLYTGECGNIHFEKGEMQIFENLMNSKIVYHLSV